MNSTLNIHSEFQQYERILRPFAFNLTHSKEETEDLLQDTFYRALSNADKFAEGTNIKAWLFTIMRNIFINSYRRKKLSRVTVDTSENQYLLNSTKRVEKNDSERSFLAEDLQAALNDVSDTFTKPFLMYYNGFHYEEIAQELNLPLGTVKSRIFFARKELQARLKNMGIMNSSLS
ncbi:MAG: RNA polymerase sigma factor [Chitinophagales bacterium]|nr:RNA polymerase sigma factor [Chitinophagales bacterium]